MPTQTANPKEVIQARLDKKLARFFGADHEDREEFRESKRLTQQVQAQYGNRFLYELIQNAADQFEHRPGRMKILLDESASKNGTLFVANTGTPFDEKRFRSITQSGGSDKSVGEHIGHKGVGFKCVRAICDAPTVYSVDPIRNVEGETFDGYCFEFGSEELFAKLANGSAKKLKLLRDEMHPWKLAAPVEPKESFSREWLDEGFVTVIELPIRSESELETVLAEIAGLRDQRSPTTLFLSDFQSIQVSSRDQSFPEFEITRKRVSSDQLNDSLRLEHVDLAEQGSWLVFWGQVSGEKVKTAADQAPEAVREAWKDWDRDAEVAVAIPVDPDADIEPTVFTYLPLGQGVHRAEAPVQGHIHAPFSPHIDRTGVDFEMRLNLVLLGGIADLCVGAAGAYRGDDRLQHVAIDLVSWDDHEDELIRAVNYGETKFRDLEIVPSIAGKEAVWERVRDAKHWPVDDLDLLTAFRVSDDAGIALVNPQLGAERIARFEWVVETLTEIEIRPRDDELSEWCECSALEIGDSWFEWSQFYGDMKKIAAGSGDELVEALRSRRILKTTTGLAAEADLAGNRRNVFLPPGRGGGSTEDLVETPVELVDRFVFIDARVFGDSPRDDDIHSFLRNFAREYNAGQILTVIGQAIKREPTEARMRGALRYAFVLEQNAIRGTREGLQASAFESAHLRVPTVTGYREPDGLMFGEGWNSMLGARVTQLAEKLGAGADGSGFSAQVILSPDEVLEGGEDSAAWGGFLQKLGVSDGLPLEASVDGSTLAPGMSEYESFDELARQLYGELVAYSLPNWSSDWREHASGQWLATNAWIETGRRESIKFVRPDEAWLRGESSARQEDLAEFLSVPRPTPTLRMLYGNIDLVVRLRDLGVCIWGTPEDATEMFEALCAAVGDGWHAAGRNDAIEVAGSDCWAALISSGTAIDAEEIPDRAIGIRSGRAEVMRRDAIRGAKLVVTYPDARSGIRSTLARSLGLTVIGTRSLEHAQAVSKLLRHVAPGARVVDELEFSIAGRGVNDYKRTDGEPLIAGGREWLLVTLAVILMEKSQDWDQRALQSRAKDISTAVNASIVRVDLSQISVSGEVAELPGEFRYAIAVPGKEDDGFLFVDHSVDLESLDGVRTICPGICELAASRDYGSRLLLELADIYARRDDDLINALTETLGVEESHVEDARQLVTANNQREAELARIAILATTGVDIADRLGTSEVAGVKKSEWNSAVQSVLAGQASVDPGRLMRIVRESVGVNALFSNLDVDLKTFNDALRKAGREPLAFDRRFADATERFLSTHRRQLEEDLRRRFYEHFESGQSLDIYVAERDLFWVDFDPEWLTSMAEPDQSLLLERAQRHLSRFGDAADSIGPLPATDEVRRENQDAIEIVFESWRDFIVAWGEKFGEVVDRVWGESDIETVLDAASKTGNCDFRKLSEEEILERVLVSYWPAALGYDRSAIELDKSEIAAICRKTPLAVKPETVLINGKSFRAGRAGYRAIYNAFQAMGDGVEIDVVELAESDVDESDQKTPPNKPGGGGGRWEGGGSESERKSVGMWGELTAKRHLEKVFQIELESGDGVLEWVSGYAEYDGQTADDSRGYDLRYTDRKSGATKYFEVKSTTSPSSTFELTRREADVAEGCVGKDSTSYSVVRVIVTGENEADRVFELGNPMDASVRGYTKRVAGPVQFKVIATPIVD